MKRGEAGSAVKARSGDDEMVLLSLSDAMEEQRAREWIIEASRLISLGEIVAGVAHELNNPLCVVLAFAQLLQTQDLDPPVKEDIARIITETERAIMVVKDLLSFARKHEPKKARLDVLTIVERVLAIKAYDLKTSNIEVETHFDSLPLYVTADQHRLEEVFLNIVTNAQQAMGDGRSGDRLLVHGTEKGDFITISFADNGAGIAPENLTAIFEPFMTTKEVGKGTGLGLSICKTLVQEQGGKIWVESETGEGATFHVELPTSKSR